MADRVSLSGPLVPLLQVFDMPKACAFYTGALGFAVREASPVVETAEGRFNHWMWLKRDSVELMLNTAHDSNERPAMADAARWAGHGDVCLYFGCDDLDTLHAELVAHGVSVDPPRATPHGIREMPFRDPDGYLLCAQAPL